MKITRIATVYHGYLPKFYSKRPGVEERPYSEQRAELDKDAFGWSDFWTTALIKAGFEARDFLCNVMPLQKAWASENGIKFSDQGWALEIARAQVLSSRPDVLFVDDYEVFTAPFLRELRESCPSIRLVLGWCGAPYRDASIFHAYDAVLSDTPELVEDFLAKGHISYQQKHGFDARILDRLAPPRPPQYDLTFIGSVIRGNQFHLQRERLLEALVQAVPLKIFSPSGDVAIKDIAKFTAKKAMHLFGLSEKNPIFPVSPSLWRHMSPGLYGLDMYQALRDSRATFNCHINISPRTANNMRLYEASGVGTCLVTDHKENIRDFFEPGKECVTYTSAEDCVEKVKWLLANQKECKAIGEAGQKRTLRDHHWGAHAERLKKIIQKHLGQAQPAASELRPML